MKNLFWLVLILIVLIRVITNQPVYKEGSRIRISSYLPTEPSIASNRQHFNLEGLKVSLPIFPEIHYGDFIVLEGIVKDGELANAILKENKLTENIFIKYRRALVDFYNHALPAPHGSLISGITIGAKSDLPKEFTDKLKNTGTTHVVVASGMNLTMLGGFALAILTKITSKKKSLVAILFIILIYCFISGFQPPIVRAAVMSVIAYTTAIRGKVSHTLQALLLSILIMLFIVPAWVRDVGFMLSSATTASLILFGTKVSSKLEFVPGVFRESLATSIAAQIGSAPIIYYFFGRVNLFSPLINAIVLWVVSPVMVIGIVGGIAGTIIPDVGKIIVLLAYPLTSWFIFIVNLFG